MRTAIEKRGKPSALLLISRDDARLAGTGKRFHLMKGPATVERSKTKAAGYLKPAPIQDGGSLAGNDSREASSTTSGDSDAGARLPKTRTSK